jgi:hypothetical protein
MRILLIIILVLLTGCQHRRVISAWHVNDTEENARSVAARITHSLGQLEPISLYDRGAGSLNIAFVGRASSSRIRSAFERIGISPRIGFDRPAEEFILRAECARRRDCDLDSMTRCVFNVQISPSEFSEYFESFSRFISERGYPVMAILYVRNADQGIILSVYFYSQCDTGVAQLSEAWQRLAHTDNRLFQRIR